jgi:hypothetical protein
MGKDPPPRHRERGRITEKNGHQIIPRCSFLSALRASVVDQFMVRGSVMAPVMAEAAATAGLQR